jgi:hypothetical protein
MNNFFNELAKRWVGESPVLFKWITRISWGLSVLMLLPQWIDGMQNGGIPFPDSWEKIVLTVAGYAVMASGFIAKLTLKSSVKEEKGLKD